MGVGFGMSMYVVSSSAERIESNLQIQAVLGYGIECFRQEVWLTSRSARAAAGQRVLDSDAQSRLYSLDFAGNYGRALTGQG